jgi:hypothetical protein
MASKKISKRKKFKSKFLPYCREKWVSCIQWVHWVLPSLLDPQALTVVLTVGVVPLGAFSGSLSLIGIGMLGWVAMGGAPFHEIGFGGSTQVVWSQSPPAVGEALGFSLLGLAGSLRWSHVALTWEEWPDLLLSGQAWELYLNLFSQCSSLVGQYQLTTSFSVVTQLVISHRFCSALTSLHLHSLPLYREGMG